MPALFLIAGAIGLEGKRIWNISPPKRFIVQLLILVLIAIKYRLFTPLAEIQRGQFLGHSFWITAAECFLALTVMQFFFPPAVPLSSYTSFLGIAALLSAAMALPQGQPLRFFQLLGILYVAAAVFFSASLRFAEPSQAGPSAGHRKYLMVALLAAAGVAGLFSGTVWSRHEQEFEQLLRKLEFSIRRPFSPPNAQIEFTKNAYLGTVSKIQFSSGQRIALRVFADQAPGYLRAEAFEYFSGSQWRSEAKAADLLPESTPMPDSLPFKPGIPVFALRQPHSDRWRILDVWPDPKLIAALFTPLGTELLQISLDSMQIYENDVLDSEKLIGGLNYTLAVPAERSPQTPADTYLQNCLRLPPNLSSRVRQLADSIFSSARTPAEKMTAVTQYFQQNYTYQLGIKVPGNQDPITWFLLEKPPAHCEYFATGAALLLRLAGVPTRYVTGFVAEEKNPYQGYWIARNQDAHAWVEAWDEQKKQWQLVEATAAGGVPTPYSASRWEYFWDTLQYQLQNLRISLHREGVKGLLVWIFLRAVFLLRWMVTTTWGLALSAVLMLLLVRRIRRTFRNRIPKKSVDADILRMNRLLTRMDRRVRKLGFLRLPGETFHQFACRIESQPPLDPRIACAADWYRSYACLRFRPDPKTPSLESLSRF